MNDFQNMYCHFLWTSVYIQFTQFTMDNNEWSRLQNDGKISTKWIYFPTENTQDLYQGKKSFIWNVDSRKVDNIKTKWMLPSNSNNYTFTYICTCKYVCTVVAMFLDANNTALQLKVWTNAICIKRCYFKLPKLKYEFYKYTVNDIRTIKYMQITTKYTCIPLCQLQF